MQSVIKILLFVVYLFSFTYYTECYPCNTTWCGMGNCEFNDALDEPQDSCICNPGWLQSYENFTFKLSSPCIFPNCSSTNTKSNYFLNGNPDYGPVPPTCGPRGNLEQSGTGSRTCVCTGTGAQNLLNNITLPCFEKFTFPDNCYPLVRPTPPTPTPTPPTPTPSHGSTNVLACVWVLMAFVVHGVLLEMGTTAEYQKEYYEELDDITRYGSKELFTDESEEAKARQIHYDDAAIDRLLDRERAGDEENTLDEVDDNGFLKAFKVANFEYVDEVEAAAEEEALRIAAEAKTNANTSERTTYWEDLLKDKYEVHKVEEFNSLGKGKRSRKQMVSVEDDDLAGLEDVSSDGEDDNYEAELSDNETLSAGAPSGRRPRKRARVDVESIPLMEGEGKSLRILGFNQSQRAAFVQVLMRFGAGDYDWVEFLPRLKQKTYEMC